MRRVLPPLESARQADGLAEILRIYYPNLFIGTKLSSETSKGLTNLPTVI